MTSFCVCFCLVGKVSLFFIEGGAYKPMFQMTETGKRVFLLFIPAKNVLSSSKNAAAVQNLELNAQIIDT